MSTRADSAASRPRSRRSIAHVPRSKMTSGLDKENSTAELRAQAFASSSKPATKDKKSRSKSLGPGGLDALQSSHGNRRQVAIIQTPPCAHARSNGIPLTRNLYIVYGLFSTEINSETYRARLSRAKHSLVRGNAPTHARSHEPTESRWSNGWKWFWKSRERGAPDRLRNNAKAPRRRQWD